MNKSQEEIDKLWWETYQEEWEYQLWMYGWAEIRNYEDTKMRQIDLICEERWGHVVYKNTVPSRLWDREEIVAVLPQNVKKRSYVRSKMPNQLKILAEKHANFPN